MSGRGKRLWAPRLAFDDAYHEVLDFLQNCRKHNLIGGPGGSPTLYHAYRIAGAWPTEGLTDASTILRFGYDRNPIGDQAKQALARLLAVATKAHFFLSPNAVVVHEPFVFVMPDLGNPGARRYGLIYPLEAESRLSTLVVAEWDVALASSHLAKLAPGEKFPVVLESDPFRWLLLKHWRTLKEEAGKQPWFETGRSRNTLLAQVNAHTDAATFPFGHLLPYPMDLNDDLRAVGAMWAKGIRRWFLPRGWDVRAVSEYLDRLKGLSPKERYALRWWTARSYPQAAEPRAD